MGDEIPELSQIAKESTSYKEFVEAVGNWLELDKRLELFINFVKAATEVKNISWSNIEASLKRNGINYTVWDKIFCTKQVAAKFNKDRNVTILRLIKSIVEYRELDFCKETAKVKRNEVIVKDERKTITKPEEPTIKKRVKMECMPEIAYFEKILEKIDKTQTIENRVKYVLRGMGIEKIPVIQQQAIFEIANTAVRLAEISFDNIFLIAKIPTGEETTSRMLFSRFVNDFVNRYGYYEKVKILNFLKELQEIVLLESEMENFHKFD